MSNDSDSGPADDVDGGPRETTGVDCTVAQPGTPCDIDNDGSTGDYCNFGVCRRGPPRCQSSADCSQPTQCYLGGGCVPPNSTYDYPTCFAGGVMPAGTECDTDDDETTREVCSGAECVPAE